MPMQSDLANEASHMMAGPASAEDLQQQIDKMKERERRVMALLNASAPERIEHDLRNVLNELVLLRTLFDPKSGD
jgi:cephalosporin hydroxylase